MSEKKFSISQALRFGWDITKENLLFFIGILIAICLILAVPSLIAKLTEENQPALSIVFNFIYLILNIIIQIGLIRIALKLCDCQKVKFFDIFSHYHLFFKFLFASILYMLILLAGFILLIIPGIIWAIKFQFFGYFVVDKGFSPIQALKASARITHGAKMDLVIFYLAILGVIILGFFALVVGLFLAIPVTMLAYAFVYRALLNKAGDT